VFAAVHQGCMVPPLVVVCQFRFNCLIQKATQEVSNACPWNFTIRAGKGALLVIAFASSECLRRSADKTMVAHLCIGDLQLITSSPTAPVNLSRQQNILLGFPSTILHRVTPVRDYGDIAFSQAHKRIEYAKKARSCDFAPTSCVWQVERGVRYSLVAWFQEP
jgi:hypothetical protein